MSERYDWPRFLVARDGAVILDEQDYLVDPTTEYGALANPHAKAFTDLPDFPILILLGEPGIGKSTLLGEAALMAEHDAGRAISFSLGDYGSEDRLIRELENIPLVEVARERRPVVLLIDSLDEGLLSIPQLARVLGRSLAAFAPVPSLRICLTCRSAVWPSTLEGRLKELWGKDSVGIYELAPLRRVDVEAALVRESLDPRPFLDEITQTGAGPLASRPVTLKLLIKLRKSGLALPSTRVDLYRQGCEHLCEEANPDRRDAGRTGQLAPKQRLTIAARIAAVLMFANKEAVWIGIDADCDPERDVTLNQLVGRCLLPDGTNLEVSQSYLWETIDTGLFTARGPNRLAFAHQTYAEFLAAFYLIQQGLPGARKLALLTSADDAARGLVPQLNEVAAWSAASDPQLFVPILERDPSVLLQSDLAISTPEQRRALVNALLQLADCGDWTDTDWGIRAHYQKLAHPNLAKQLEPWIEDKMRFLVARRAAIDIAEACDLQDLQNVLVQLALDSSEEYSIRHRAARTIGVIGDTGSKLRLRPLLHLDQEEDPHEDLKGSALRALWPNALSAEALFACLGPPKQEFYFGSYQSFLSQELVPALSERHLPVALRWLRDYTDGTERGVSFDDVSSAIIYKAFEHLERPGVLRELALTIWLRLRQYLDILSGTRHSRNRNPLDDVVWRRRLLGALLPLLQDPDADVTYLVSSTQVLRSDDVPWLIEIAQRSAPASARWTLGRLIDNALSPLHFNHVLDACGEDDVLRRALPSRCQPLILGSDRANAAREAYQLTQRLRARLAIPLLDPPPEQRIRNILEQIETGKPQDFIGLILAMTLEPRSTHYSTPPVDLTDTPGWKEADAGNRRRIVNAAFEFLRAGVSDSHLARLLDTNSIPCSCIAGLGALYLVEVLHPERYDQLSCSDWECWDPVVLAAFYDPANEHREWFERTLQRAYTEAPDALRSALRRLIDRDRNIHREVLVTSRLKPIRDEYIAVILLQVAKSTRDEPAGVRKPA